jgi:predicted porin
MKRTNPRLAKSLTQILIATSVAATAPAWSADAAQTSNEALLKRLDALTQEMEQLRALVKTNDEKASKAAEEARAMASRPVAAPVGKSVEQGLSKQASEEIANSTDMSEGIEIVKTPKANLKFYGMVDVGAEVLHGTLAKGVEIDSSMRVSNGLITPHFGVLGTGQLTDGLQGSFNMEGSFAPDAGTSGIGGRLFGRQAWVGLSGAFGTVRLGRQYTAVRMGWDESNPYGTGNQGLRLLDPRISNPRADNSISYVGTFGGITAGLNYSPGWDAVNGNATNSGPANNGGANCAGEVPDQTQQCKEVSAGLKYSGGNWGVAVSHEQLFGGTSTTYGGLTSPAKIDRRNVLSAFYRSKGGMKLAAGWVNRDNMGNATTPKSDMYWVQGIVPLGQHLFVDGLLAHLKYADSANKATLLNLRGRYVLNKDTTIYMTLANMDNDGALALPATASTPVPTPLAGAKQYSLITGVLYKF